MYDNNCNFINVDYYKNYPKKYSGIDKSNLSSENFALSDKEIVRIGSSIVSCKKKISVIILYFPGHLNVLIYRKDQNVFEHFEPHGEKIDNHPDYTSLDAEKFLKFLASKLNEKGYIPSGYQVLNSVNTCPILSLPSDKRIGKFTVGFQALEVLGRPKGVKDDGFCSQWTLFYIELVLSYPEIDTFYIYNKVLKYLAKIGPDAAYRFIRAYSYFDFYTYDKSLKPIIYVWIRTEYQESEFKPKFTLSDIREEEIPADEIPLDEEKILTFESKDYSSEEQFSTCYDLSKMKPMHVYDYIKEDEGQNIIILLDDIVLCWKRKYFTSFINQDKKNIIYFSYLDEAVGGAGVDTPRPLRYRPSVDTGTVESQTFYRVYFKTIVEKAEFKEILQKSPRFYFFRFVKYDENEDDKFYKIVSYSLKDYESVLSVPYWDSFET